jgi:hypothetical protein
MMAQLEAARAEAQVHLESQQAAFEARLKVLCVAALPTMM